MLVNGLIRLFAFGKLKRWAELRFWRREIDRYRRWFNGELSPLYKTPSPQIHEKVKAPNEKDASILTWHKLHQEAKYLEDLDLPPDSFRGMKLLEVGSGPMPSATCFKGSRLYCLEPLLPQYLEAGFPLHYYDGVNFIHGPAEKIPVKDNFFDAVISVNAIDHVDNIEEAAKEIRRVLKPSGLFRMHIHYHRATTCEPVEIDDDRFLKLFSWCGNLKKIKISTKSHSRDLPENESYVLWSNFEVAETFYRGAQAHDDLASRCQLPG
jgi:SAM-dependent methyltransferase